MAEPMPFAAVTIALLRANTMLADVRGQLQAHLYDGRAQAFDQALERAQVILSAYLAGIEDPKRAPANG